MNQSKRRLLQGVCTGILCFFSLFSCAAAALAWYCNNKAVKNNGMTTKSEKDDLHARYFVYKYNKEEKGSNIDEEKEGEDNLLDIKNFSLNTYDTIFVAQNRFTPALIRIHIYGRDLPSASSTNPQDITVRIHRDTAGDYGFAEDEEEPEIEEGENIEYYYKTISNVGNFALTAPSLADYDSYDDYLDSISNINNFFTGVMDDTFKGTDENYTQQTKNGFTFFFEENDEQYKRSTLSLSTTYTKTIPYEITDGDDTYTVNSIVLYLCIDYDTNLLKKFTSNSNISLSSGIGQLDTKLVSDLNSIEVKLGNIQ